MSKTCPSCGYRESDLQATYCNKCGYPFPRNQQKRPAASAAPASRQAPHTAQRPPRKKAGNGGFLSFGSLITENHLKLIYILGAALIVLLAIMGIAGMFGKESAGGANMSVTNMTAMAEHPAASPLFWIGFLIAGSILWRMFCELFVLLSRVHGSASPIGEAYEEESEEYEGEGTGGFSDNGEEGQMVECPKCHKIVPVEDLRECEHCGIQGCSHCIRSMGLLKKSLTCRECYEGK